MESVDPKWDRLISSALELFSKNGFRATTVKMILQRSGLPKKTFYYYFESKEDLITAVLRRYTQQFASSLRRRIRELASTPIEQILATFDVAYEWFAGDHFYGCIAINAIAEYSAANSPIRAACKTLKELTREIIYELCMQTEIKNPDQCASQLALLLDGAIVNCQILQNPDAAKIAKSASRVLLGLPRGD